MSKSKKKRTHLRKAIVCLLCDRESNQLSLYKVCKCATEESDYNYTYNAVDGKLVAAILKKEELPRLQDHYEKLKKEKVKSEPITIDKINKATPTGIGVSRRDKNKFYQSWEWKAVRYAILNKFGAKCMLCGATNQDSKICVDHIKPISLFWDLRLAEDNLQVLCDDCNKGKSNKSQKDFR
jgi:hypothetical protein